MEASAINDVYNDLRDYQQESPESAAIIDMLADYVEGHTRWDHVALSEERLSRRTWAAYRRIDETLRDLEPANEHQRDLRTQMLADWESVLGLRNRLQIATNARMPFLFWLVAVSGFFAVLFPCFIYSSSPQNLTMLGMFAAFNGIVLYAIFAIGNPLMGPGAVESTTQLHSLLETMNRP